MSKALFRDLKEEIESLKREVRIQQKANEEMQEYILVLQDQSDFWQRQYKTLATKIFDRSSMIKSGSLYIPLIKK